MRSESFPKTARLRKRAEYLRVQELGRKVHSEHFLLLLHPSPGGATPGGRVGITVSSRVGKAVTRNRIKRWVREYVRHGREELPPGDLVVVARGTAAAAAHAAVDEDLARLFRRARGAR